MSDGHDRIVYILLTRSGTAFSRLIAFISGAGYTHAAIGFEGQNGPYWSFGRLCWRLPFPGGLVRERLDAGLFGAFPGTPCRLLAVEAGTDLVDAAERRLSAMWSERGSYFYDLPSVAAQALGVSLVRPYGYFCSGFVAEVLSGSGMAQLPKPWWRMRPDDFMGVPGSRLVYSGPIGGILGIAAPKRPFGLGWLRTALGMG